MDQALLAGELFGFLLIFVRIGAALMLIPGFGESYVLPTSRLLLALLLSLALTAPLAPLLPPLPAAPLGLATLVAGEAMIGAFIGLATRIVFAALHVAGATIAVQSGLASATIFDPAQSTQGTLPGNFLTSTATVLLFVTEGHHMLLHGLISSYQQLPAAADALPLDDMADLISRLVQESFTLGVRIAAPLLLVGILTNLAMGVLNRLMPTFQVFFIALPLQLLLTIATMMLSFAGSLLLFFAFLDGSFATFTGFR
jgi:flagellar biosynthetic protein FliR